MRNNISVPKLSRSRNFCLVWTHNIPSWFGSKNPISSQQKVSQLVNQPHPLSELLPESTEPNPPALFPATWAIPSPINKKNCHSNIHWPWNWVNRHQCIITNPMIMPKSNVPIPNHPEQILMCHILGLYQPPPNSRVVLRRARQPRQSMTVIIAI